MYFAIMVNDFFSGIRHDKSGNEQFLTELSKWVFHERGHLKVSKNSLAAIVCDDECYAYC